MLQAHHRGRAERTKLAARRADELSARMEAALERQRETAATMVQAHHRGYTARRLAGQVVAERAAQADRPEIEDTAMAGFAEQRRRAIEAAMSAEREGDRRRALLAYFSAVKLSLLLLPDASGTSRRALALASKALTARAIRLQGTDRGDNAAVALADQMAMAADALNDNQTALQLYRDAIALAVEEEEEEGKRES